MPELFEPVDPGDLQRFFLWNWETALIIGVLLIILWFAAPRLIAPAVRRLLKASAGEFEDGGVAAIELAKRTSTIESLTLGLVRLGILVAIVFIVIGLLDIWGLLAGVGLFLAALTLAGQPLVLDFLMGMAIVLEGTYFKGDSIAVGDPKWKIFGTVESVGLRHTVIRAPDGTEHSISNRLMSQVSNRTRVYAGGDVTVRGIQEEDFGRVLEIMDRVGREVAEDPAFAGSVIEVMSVKYVGDPDDLGWTATMRGRVLAGERWTVGTEVRKRLASALLEAGIELNKRGVAPRARGAEPGSDAPYYVPPPPGDDD